MNIYTEMDANANVVTPKPGGYAKIRGYTEDTSFNDQTVQILGFIERENRWVVELVNSQKLRKYDAWKLKVENLYPIPGK